MRSGIRGIHHVTAIASDPRRNLEFYTEALGLRLVKKTVNFDDPGTYHFYYGDEEGRPGTILTFFPWPGARRGSRGVGQATVTSFQVPEGSLDFWRRRLERRGAPVDEPGKRFGKETLACRDPDGLLLELVAEPDAGEAPFWERGSIGPEAAVRGFSGVTLRERRPEVTASLLTDSIGFRPAGEEGSRYAFELGSGGPGSRLELEGDAQGEPGRIAAGTVHHVAFRVAGDPEQVEWRQRIAAAGLQVTPILDRHYFRSIYFREPGGVLFEIATDPPGFSADEPVESLGQELRLPPWLEGQRARIEALLPELPTQVAVTD